MTAGTPPTGTGMARRIAEHSRPRASRKGRAAPAQLVSAAVLLAMACAVVAAREDANRSWLMEAFRRTGLSLLETAAAFVLFLVVFAVGIGAMAVAFRRYSERKGRLAAVVCAFLIALLLVNALPILVYVEALKGAGIQAYGVRVLALLTANAMLYYFFSGFLFDLWRETRKLYVVSAPFKGADALDYLRERAQWALLSNLSPLFYYLFSFTLFTDLLLQGYQGRNDVGIVLSLFNILIHDWSATGLWRFTVYLLIMMAMVLPARFLLDFGLTAWEKRRRMVQQVV